MRARTSLAIAMAVLLALATVGTVASTTQQAESSVTVTASPTDWGDAEATHAVVFTVESSANSTGEPIENLVVDYEPGTAPADVSNVGPESVRWVGVDRDGDDPGTSVDTRSTVTGVTDAKDGQALGIETEGDIKVLAGDEVVVVYGGVQNPQEQGTTVESTVNVTLNQGGANDVASSAVTYEYNDANVSMADQETTGESVTVDSVSLSEPGFVVVLNESGRNPDAVRGATYLGAGTHRDVEVPLDPPVTRDEELASQVHLDTDGDQRFGYDGDAVDRPFEDRDGNLLATDTALVTTNGSDDGTNTTGTATATPTASATPTPTDSESTPVTVDGTDGDGTNGTTDTPAAATDTPTDSATEESPEATDDESDGGDSIGTVTADETDGSDGDGAGFGALAGLAALGGAALLARRGR